MTILLNNREHGRRIAEAARWFYADHYPVISRVNRKGELLGGVIYTGYRKASIEIHASSLTPTWLSRTLLWAMFHYPFVELGVKKLFGPIPANNVEMLDFACRLGFVPDNLIREVFPDEDLVLLAMRPDQCRWLDLGARGETISR